MLCYRRCYLCYLCQALVQRIHAPSTSEHTRQQTACRPIANGIRIAIRIPLTGGNCEYCECACCARGKRHFYRCIALRSRKVVGIVTEVRAGHHADSRIFFPAECSSQRRRNYTPNRCVCVYIFVNERCVRIGRCAGSSA